jgi:hypothetical protein
LLRQEAESPPVERQAKIAAAGATTVRKAQAKIHSAPDTDLEVEIEERKGMAAGGVPEPYLDAWARLQCQRPGRHSGKPSMTQAGSSINWEASPSSANGPLASFSM